MTAHHDRVGASFRGGTTVDEAVAFSWVSTADGQQTIENQRRALDEIAERAG
jgi:hypothetical protein